MKVFSGRSNNQLATSISNYLDMPLGELSIFKFSDGEIGAAFEENVRSEDVYIIQSTNPPAENIIELTLILDAARSPSAHKALAVIP